MEGLEAVRNARKQSLSLHPDAATEQLLDFLNEVQDDLRDWLEVTPISAIIDQLDEDAAE